MAPLEKPSRAHDTTEANALQPEIHDRMPVDEADYDAWLDSGQQDRETLERLLVPFPAERMTTRPVSQFVNNSRHEGPECIGPPGAP